MKSFLAIILSAISFVIKILVFFPAFFVLDFPFWLALLAIAVIAFVPVIGSLLNIGLWIWALVVCLAAPVTPLSIIFYILFSLYALDLIQALVRTFISR